MPAISSPERRRKSRWGTFPKATFAAASVATFFAAGYQSVPPSHQTLSASFTRRILRPPGESPFDLRFFETAVKTDSRGRIITGQTSDPVKNIVGPESAGERGGLERYTKIMFGASYLEGRPDPGTRIDPNNPKVNSGNQYWPFIKQPFRSWPTSLALTPDGAKLYVTLPGRDGYPDWRVAAVNTSSRAVKWIDLRIPGNAAGTKPVGIEMSPLNTAIYKSPYAVVLNQYGNFASVVDTASDTVLGEFQTDFYAEKAKFNRSGTRLYVTDRFTDAVRVFSVSAGPRFQPMATIPTGKTDLERTNPRDLDLSADGTKLYVANTLGHTIAVIDVANDANRLVGVMPVGGLATDVKIAGRWGIVAGHETNTVLNGPETGHGLPKKDANGNAMRNDGSPLGYLPVMTDATKATTFDDLGSEINVFDTSTNRFVYRYVDRGRDDSMLVVPGQIVNLGDHAASQKIIRGSGPEQVFVRGNLLFATMMHSDKLEAFTINQNPSSPAGILTPAGFEFTGGITPQGVVASPDGKHVYVANMQTEDVSFLTVGSNGTLVRDGYVPVGVTDKTPDPTNGGNGSHLFATDEEAGLRWLYTAAYSDDNQKSCGHCHWQSRQDGCQWNVAANAVGGVKVCPQNKDLSDNWPEWYEGLNNGMLAYASACNGEVVNAEKKTALFPQDDEIARMRAREDYVLRKTEENSKAIGRSDISGKAFKVGYYDMAYLQILWTQNEARRMPNPLSRATDSTTAAAIARGKWLFTSKTSAGGAGCADCHHNGNVYSNGVLDDTFQDYNIHEPGVVSETTVDGNGPFYRPGNDYFLTKFAPPQDEGTPQNLSSRNTKHLRTMWDSVPRWLHHGDAHTFREILLAPDSSLLGPGERGFNFRTVRTNHSRVTGAGLFGVPAPVLPTQVPITFGDSRGGLAGDGMGALYVSLDSPFVTTSTGGLQIDRLGTSNLIPLVVVAADGKRAINPNLAAQGIRVIKDTHGKTSHLSSADIDALVIYLKSLQ